jgi:SOS-response transcriptional repressor LexA
MPRKPDPEPSEKQKEILEFIVLTVSQKGFQPSQQEMADHFGITKNAVAQRLDELAKRGLIEMVGKNRERAISLKGVKFKPYAAD